MEAVKPRWLFHGHYHRRNSERVLLRDGWEVKVEGLDCENGFAKSWYITDLRDLAPSS